MITYVAFIVQMIW